MSQLELLKSLGVPAELITALEDEVERKDTLIHWDDLRIPLTRDRQGVAAKPDYDFTNMGLLFPNGDPSEIVYIQTQMPHRMLLGSDLYPHIHFVQDVVQQPTFKLDYRWYENNGDPTGGFTTITATSFMFSWTSGSILQIAVWDPIDGSGIDSVSSMLDIKLYRDDVVVAGDVLAKEFDMHYQIDTPGSPQEYYK
jgi:hypothetical protein